MRRTEYLNRRLAIAIREAEDADRIWRRTMELPVAVDDERQLEQAARRLHAVWQEREWALARVAELRALVNPDRPAVSRLARVQRRASFLRWHAGRRAPRSAASR